VRPRNGYMIAGAGSALILASTLWPSSGDAPRELSFWCLLCGSRDTADSLVNILLFLPFGAGLAIVRGLSLAVGGSFALSGAVELIQTTLPGRFSTLGDILFNSAGGAIGAFLVVFRARITATLIAPPMWGKTLAGLLPPAVFAATAILSAPSLPERAYYGQWTHEIGKLHPYPGRVVSASVGGLPLPDRRVPDQEAVRQALRVGEPLRLEVVAGPEPPELSHLFAIYDDWQREVLLIAVQGSDLVFQRRTLSVQLRFDQPFLRWRSALNAREGDPVRIAVRQEARSLCLEVDDRERCNLSFGVGGGWRLIHRLWGAPPVLAALLGVIWLSILSFPAGAALVGVGRGIHIGLAFGALGILASWWSPWLSPQLIDLVAPVPGAWAGWAMRTLMLRRA